MDQALLVMGVIQIVVGLAVLIARLVLQVLKILQLRETSKRKRRRRLNGRRRH